MSAPLVSVVVNNHNYRDFVCTAVDSALAQTHPRVEVVVVDDGSTDGSLDLLASYGDRIRLVPQPQSGQTAALNAGFAASAGDILVFLDADDVLYPHAAAAVAGALDGSAAVKAHGPLNVVDTAGRLTGAVLPRALLAHGDVRAQALSDGPQSICFTPTSGNAWRRSFLAEVMPLPILEGRLSIGTASVDSLLSMLASVSGPVERLDEPLGEYRLHESNRYATRTFENKVGRHVRLADAQFAIVEELCRRRGIAVDVARWRRRSWFHRVEAWRSSVRAAIDPADTCVLIDDGEWGPSLDSNVRYAWFGARDDLWWGPPADDTAALAELDRLVRAGASHVAVAWQSFWWRQCYPAMFELLDREWRTAAVTDDLWLFSR